MSPSTCLPDLTDADLRELGVASLGDRKRLLKAAAPACAIRSRAAACGCRSAAVAHARSAGGVPLLAWHRNEEGERRHATVMFSDLTGYTALNEAFDPEEVEQVMARIKREAVAVIERHGGRVNQFVGDEVMAMFGVPVARRDDARRAVRAALELHETVDAIAAGPAGAAGAPVVDAHRDTHRPGDRAAQRFTLGRLHADRRHRQHRGASARPGAAR